MIRTAIRATLAAALTLFALYSASAVAAQAPGWPILALTAAVLLWIVAIALMRRAPHRN
jgi:hypothetical protein